MSNRMELNEEALEQVVGGAFHFYKNEQKQFRCRVDGIGTYYARIDAFGALAAYASDTSLTAQQVVDWGFANGYLSNEPF